MEAPKEPLASLAVGTLDIPDSIGPYKVETYKTYLHDAQRDLAAWFASYLAERGVHILTTENREISSPPYGLLTASVTEFMKPTSPDVRRIRISALLSYVKPDAVEEGLKGLISVSDEYKSSDADEDAACSKRFLQQAGPIILKTGFLVRKEKTRRR